MEAPELLVICGGQLTAMGGGLLGGETNGGGEELPGGETNGGDEGISEKPLPPLPPEQPKRLVRTKEE